MRAFVAAVSVAVLSVACVHLGDVSTNARERLLEVRFVSVPFERLDGLSSVWAYLDETAEPPGVHELYRRNGLRVGRVRRRDAARVREILRRDLGATISEAKPLRSYPRDRGMIRIGTGEESPVVTVHLDAGRSRTFDMSGRTLVLRVAFENVGVKQARISLVPLIMEQGMPDGAQRLDRLALSILCARGEMVLVAPDGIPREGLSPMFITAEGAATQVILVSVTSELD